MVRSDMQIWMMYMCSKCFTGSMLHGSFFFLIKMIIARIPLLKCPDWSWEVGGVTSFWHRAGYVPHQSTCKAEPSSNHLTFPALYNSATEILIWTLILPKCPSKSYLVQNTLPQVLSPTPIFQWTGLMTCQTLSLFSIKLNLWIGSSLLLGMT